MADRPWPETLHNGRGARAQRKREKATKFGAKNPGNWFLPRHLRQKRGANLRRILSLFGRFLSH
jgi:hypothetical protein